jgi:uncharacterized protein
MRLNLDAYHTVNTIRGYGNGQISIKELQLRSSIIVTPEQLITDWKPQRFEQLSAADFDILTELKPEIVLVGTGERHRFVHPRLLRPILEQNLGVEVMATAAACRTYNVIVAEGRRVAAALIII